MLTEPSGPTSSVMQYLDAYFPQELLETAFWRPPSRRLETMPLNKTVSDCLPVRYDPGELE